MVRFLLTTSACDNHTTTASYGSRIFTKLTCWKRLNSAGNVFFFARSPEAPNSTMDSGPRAAEAVLLARSFGDSKASIFNSGTSSTARVAVAILQSSDFFFVQQILRLTATLQCVSVPLRRLANATGGGDPCVNFFEHSSHQASLGRLHGENAKIWDFPQMLRSDAVSFAGSRQQRQQCSPLLRGMLDGKCDVLRPNDRLTILRRLCCQPRGFQQTREFAGPRCTRSTLLYQEYGREKISSAMARALPRSFLCSFHRAASSSSIPTTPHGCDTIAKVIIL